MTNELAYNFDQDVHEWVSNELGVGKIVDGDVRSIGVVRDGKLIAGIVFHGYKGFMVDASLATTDKKWCTKSVLRAFFEYPFNVLGCVRFQATCSKKNKPMRKLFEKLGFKFEGKARKAFNGKDDAMIYSMLKNECRWI